MTERVEWEARIAALAVRRGQGRVVPVGTTDLGGEASTAPASPLLRAAGDSGPRRRGRRAPALANRVLVAGLSVAAGLSLVAFFGAGTVAGANTNSAAPATVIHRIVVVASPPPPPDVVFQVVPAGQNVTVVTATPPQPAPTATVKPKPVASTPTAAPVTTTKASGKKP